MNTIRLAILPLKTKSYLTVDNEISIVYEMGVFNMDTGKLIDILQTANTNERQYIKQEN